MFAAIFCLVLLVHTSVQAGITASQHVEPTNPTDFSLTDADGKLHQLSAYRGGWVVVNFWATWCGPCVREMPILQKIARSDQSMTMIGVNFEQISRTELAAALSTLRIDYLNVQAGETPLVPFEPLIGLPSTFLVAPDGTLVYRHTGEISEAALQAALDEARRRFADRQP